jgi:cyanophycinase
MSRIAAAALIALLLSGPGSAEARKGTLFIIGGGKRPPAMMKEFLALGGGSASAHVVVIPMASSEPETSGTEQAQQFRALGARDTKVMIFNREEALMPETAERLDGATAVFFTGGDQSRLMEVLRGTPVQEKLFSLYESGAVLGGTSAGAAVMSAVMLTGDERLNTDSSNAYVFIRRGNIITADGLGFLSSVIIDQHFIKRKRHNRLISLVLEHPELVGVGIDEATAIIVQPDSTFRVTGEGSVLVLDARRSTAIRTDAQGNLGGGNLVLHLLMAGDVFQMKSGAVIPGRSPR